MSKKKEKAKKIKRKVAVPGYCLICFLAVMMLWPADAVRRRFYKPEPAEGEGIIADGTFLGTTKSTDLILETKPSVSTGNISPASETTAPSTELLMQEASARFGSHIPSGCVAVPQEKKSLNSGIMLRLDSEHAFSGVVGELVTFEGKNDSYRMKNMDLTAKSEVVEAMNKMASAYQTVTGRADLMIYSTSAVYEAEGSLYPVELPDRATGYCMDLCILNEDGTISKIDTEHEWLTENAWLYGFVFSYTEADAEATGIEAAPYHLRYVGRENAGIMHEQGLTLNQYFEALQTHDVSDPFYYLDGSTKWSVYYVPAGMGETEVPVPLNAKYEISGDNADGFIVKAEGEIN